MRRVSLALVFLALVAPALGQDREQAKKLVDQGVKILLGANFEEKALRQSVDFFTQAIKVDRSYAPAYVQRSLAYQFLQEEQKAQSDALVALELGIEPTDYTFVAGAFEGERARKILRQGMVKAGPKSWIYNHLWLEVTQTYWYEGRFREQVAELEKLIQADPKPLYYSFLGSARDAAGDFKGAEAAYRKAGKESDSILRCRMHSGDLPGAEAALTELRSTLDPKVAAIWEAALAILQQRHPENAAELARGLDLEEIGGYYQFFSGLLWLESGDKERARKDLKEFVEMTESNPTEWGVTMRWEAARARQVLSGI